MTTFVCRLVPLIAFLFAASASIGAESGFDWPCFRGPSADGLSAEKGINTSWKEKPPQELWRMDMGNRGFSGPSVVGDKVFIIDRKDSQDIVLALSLADGKEVWRFAYDESTGENYGFARATPTYDAGKLYTLSAGGHVYCLDAADGRPVWDVDIQKQYSGKMPQWHYSMSILIDGDAVIACPGGTDSAVVALNKVNGKPIWVGGGSDIPGYATPVVATIQNIKQYVIFGGTSVFGVDSKSGKQLWQVPWKTQYDVNAATPIVLGNSVFITSGYRHGCAMIDVAADGAKIRWENKDVQAHFNTPVFCQGSLYATSDPNKLVCLDPQTGTARWTQRGFGKEGIVGLDGVLIGIDGITGEIIMAAMDPTAYKELGRIAILKGGDKQYWTAPIVASGKLVVRDLSTLICLGLK